VDSLQPVPLVEAPVAVLKGLPALVKCDFLENRRHVLAKDSVGHCSVWDVTSGKKVYTPMPLEREPQYLARGPSMSWKGAYDVWEGA